MTETTTRRTGKKATNLEIQARVDAVKELIGKLCKKTQIRQICAKEWGVSWTQADRYAVLARAELAKEYGKERPEHLAEAFAFFQTLFTNPKAAEQVKLNGRIALNAMLGLNAPTKQEVSGPAGAPIPVENKYSIDTSGLTKEQCKNVLSALGEKP